MLPKRSNLLSIGSGSCGNPRFPKNLEFFRRLHLQSTQPLQTTNPSGKPATWHFFHRHDLIQLIQLHSSADQKEAVLAIALTTCTRSARIIPSFPEHNPFLREQNEKSTSKCLLLIARMDVARRRCGMLEAMTYFWRDSFDNHC